MKAAFLAVACLASLALCSCQGMRQEQISIHQPTEEAVMSMQRTYAFIKEAGHYFLATVDGDQARVRPFGTIHIFENRLYIQTGRQKNVARQLVANGKAEICALKGDEWIRVSGVLVDDNRREPKASMLEEYASLKAIGYSADDENTMVLYFKPGTVTATIYSFKNPPVVMTF